MPSAEPETQPPPQDAAQRRQANKRKRETPAHRLANKAQKTSTPNAYARRSPPREAAPAAPDEGDRSPPRKLKRPGARATADRDASERLRKEREIQQRKDAANRQTSGVELVADHYNAVPERGREWRSTESRIKGLRSLNNWIKSTLIQKFSRPDVPVQQLLMLDMACGKGGDLGKWEKAPQVPALYVGCDIASVSIDQARDRYAETLRRNSGRHRRGVQMQAEFYVQDTFGHSLAEIATVRSVGFDPNAGPGPSVIQGRMMSGGFDVVSMMFALHYSFESEQLARGMLKNVAGALKKGGRFIGVMPNSDVISATVKKLLQAEEPGKTPNGKAKTPQETNGKEECEEDDDWDPEKPSEAPADGAGGVEEDDWDPEKPSEPQPAPTNGAAPTNEDADDEWDPEKPSEPAVTTHDPSATQTLTESPANTTAPAQNGAASTPYNPDAPPLEWGNGIYTVRFPRHQPLTKRSLPRDGIFRPPYGWKYHYNLEEAVDVPEYVVPWEGFRALAEDYGLELLYRKSFSDVFADESEDRELGILAERMGVRSRDRSLPNNGLLVSEEEMEAASFYHAFCFYKT